MIHAPVHPCSGKKFQILTFNSGIVQKSEFSDTAYNFAYVSDVQIVICKTVSAKMFDTSRKFFKTNCLEYTK